MALTITSASAVYMLSIPGVFGGPQQLQGFGVDDAFDAEAVDSAVVQTGVDGHGVAGWVPREVPQTITLIAASPSFVVFDSWIAAMDALYEIIYASAVISIPSIGRKYTCLQGALTRYPTMPAARRVLNQRAFTITWMPPGNRQPAIINAPI